MQPDLLIVYGEITKNFLDFPPALVAEILSPSTALWDRHTKFDIYEQQGIHYYLIIDPEKNTVEVYQLLHGKYTLVPPPDNVSHFIFDEGCSALVSWIEIW